MRSLKGDLLAGLVVSALALLCFARLAASPGSLLADASRESVDRAQRDDFRPPGNDLTFVYLPHHLHVAAEIGRTGALPGWDRSGFAGRPMIGNPQGGLFYPPVWIAWWSRSPAALGWLTFGHLLGAALGTYVLVREMGAGRIAATVASGCFLASPYVLAHVFEGHYPHVWTVSWYPWAFWSYRRWRGASIDGAVLLAAILALAFLAGHPQEWYYLVVVLGAWVVFDATRHARRREFRASLVTVATWSLVVGLSLGLAAVELIPDMAAQPWTLHGNGLDAARISHYQLRLVNVLQLLSPTALGGPADYLGHDNYWETVLSIGLVPLVLAAIAVARHPEHRLVRGWLILVVGAVLFAAGHRAGFFSLLFKVVPGMNRFRVPGRSLFLATLGAAVLAGLGVETIASRPFQAADWRWLHGRVRLATLVIGSFLAVLLVQAWEDPPRPVARPERPLSLREIRTHLRTPSGGASREALAAQRIVNTPVFWLALGGIAACVALARRKPERRSLWASALGLLALIELGAYGHELCRVSPPAAFLGPDPISNAFAALPRRSDPFRIRARDTLYHDLRAWSNGFEKININDSFQIQHAADLYEPLYALLYPPDPPRSEVPMDTAVDQFQQEVRQAMLDRLSVAYLVSDHVESAPSWPLAATGRFGGSRFAIHQNPTALPRAYVVPRALPVGTSAWSVARLRNIDPREAVVMAADPLESAGPRQPFTPATWCVNEADHLELGVTTEAPGLLVVADTWMPGWTAELDGRPSLILRGNRAQRVIPIDRAGDHRVTLRYEAPGFRAGLVATAVSAGLWLSLAFGAVCLRRFRTDRSEVGVPASSALDRYRPAEAETPTKSKHVWRPRPTRAASGATIRESKVR